MKNLPFLLAALILIGTQLHAQDNTQTRPIAATYWTAVMSGGEYIVPHSQITSIAKHAYEVDGTFSVTEVTIGTSGSEIGRFYFFEPVTPESPATIGQSALDTMKEKVMELSDRSGLGLTSKVIKNYPTTTHAHTIEYRLENIETLNKLYNSLKLSYMRRQNITFKEK
ncbi:MAG: hypothetical protein ACK5NG_05175 [Chthoniobacterales bacterium]